MCGVTNPLEERADSRIIEILTAAAHGEANLEAQLVQETLSDDVLLVAAFASLVSFAEALLDSVAGQMGMDRTALIQKMALMKAARDKDK